MVSCISNMLSIRCLSGRQQSSRPWFAAPLLWPSELIWIWSSWLHKCEFGNLLPFFGRWSNPYYYLILVLTLGVVWYQVLELFNEHRLRTSLGKPKIEPGLVQVQFLSGSCENLVWLGLFST